MTTSARTSANATMFALVVGTGLQLLMVVAGHYMPAVAALFAPIGVSIALVAGLVYALSARPATRGEAGGRGALVGGGCALLGVLVSLALGDVPVVVVAIATVTSAVTGILGALLGAALRRRPADAGAPAA